MAQLDRILATFEEYCVVTQSVQSGFPVGVTVHDGSGAQLKYKPNSKVIFVAPAGDAKQ